MKTLGRPAFLLILQTVLAASGCASLVRPTAARFEPSKGAAHRGLDRFVFDDFGLLDTTRHRTTVPWKLMATALVQSEAKGLGLSPDHHALARVLEQFGLVVPDSVANWPSDAGPAPRLGDSIGQTRGTARSRVGGLEIELGSPGCPQCHAGILYDEGGRPTRSAWLGIPNASLHLDLLNQTMLASTRAAMRDEHALLQAMRRVFPEISNRELRTYARAVLPRLRRRLAETEASEDPVLPFNSGGAGTVNTVAGRLIAAGVKPGALFRKEQNAIISVPILTNRAFRTSLMWDGSFAAPGSERFMPVTRDQAKARGSVVHAGLLAVFSIGETGVFPARVPKRLESFREVAAALDDLRPPPFPGPVDRELAALGARVFAQRCSSCHGDYEMSGGRSVLSRYPNRLVPLETIGTDRERADIAPSVVAAMRDHERSRPAFRYADIEPTSGYVAPILDGVWITAPYLHNGSVPTLWHLMHPKERPTTFEVGGHLLDYDRMGIALVEAPAEDGDEGCGRRLRFPPDWKPRSRSSICDTRLRGRSNAGHDSPFNRMTEAEKRAVLEFLKAL